MKSYLLLAVLLVLPLTACESPTAPEATQNEEIPADARVIDLDYFFFPGTVTFRVTPNELQPSTKILPPPTRLKVVIWVPPTS